MLWVLIFIFLLAAAGLSFFYLVTRFYQFGLIRKLSKEKKKYRIAASVLAVVVPMAVIWFAMGLMNAIVCMLHLVVFWLLADFVFWIIKKSGHRPQNPSKRYYAGILAILLTAAYLTAGWELDHHVRQTIYAVETDKAVGNLRIVQFADSHIGTTFGGKGFAEHIRKMQELNPDVVLVTGDFVDDDTSREEMSAACEALGMLRTTYGVYFAFGNHDKGYYGKSYRGYDGDDLANELEKNNVTVLEDESVLLDDRFYIVGRKDRSEEMEHSGTRKSMEELTENLDHDKFMIVMDHQPCDYDDQKKTGMDLVLSGHTHGGQLIPINLVGELVSENNKTYGHEKRGGTDFIVTSGISDWALLFKTGCSSEYVVVEVKSRFV